MITLDIPTSKSITNRALIIDAITGNKCTLKSISTSRDSQIMQRLLAAIETDQRLDVQDAGTVMRFLTSYTAISGQKKTLKGSDRMHNRPIKILVDALRSIGAKIDYLEKEGYPPIEIKGYTSLKAYLKLAIDGSVSSQYISSLLMIAPMLEEGLELCLVGKVGSRPYIQMTLDLMRHFGIESKWNGNKIVIPGTTYVPNQLVIEPDWSSASYWYSFVSLSGLLRGDEKTLLLKGYTEDSLQGDSVVRTIYQQLGVSTTFNNDGMLLTVGKPSVKELTLDFSDCPDIAQTVLVTCALHKIKLHLTGLESLRIKETDRIQAMQNELSKLNVQLIEIEENKFSLEPSKLNIPPEISITTYEDHRMAMAFAPLKQFCTVEFENPEVVAKSYPTFWEDLNKVL